MYTIFHDNQIWGQVENGADLKDPPPLYALCHSTRSGCWWMWYHSWNNVTDDIRSGGRELPPVARTYLLLLGRAP
jgi:hypothetical protein